MELRGGRVAATIAMMKNVFLLLPAFFLLAGCASHDDASHKKNSYAELERKKDADEDNHFFYGRWLNPNAEEPDPNSIPTPGWMHH